MIGSIGRGKMVDFDQILDDCIQKMMAGSATLEQCLREYPAEAAVLEPLLRAAIRLDPRGLVHPSPAYREKARAQLKRHLRLHPRAGQEPGEEKAPGDPDPERDQAFSLGFG